VQPGTSTLVTLGMVPFQPGEERPYFESGFQFNKFAIQGPNGKYLKYAGSAPDGLYAFTEADRSRASCFMWLYRVNTKYGSLYTPTANATCAQAFPVPDTKTWKGLLRIAPMANFRGKCDATRFLQLQPVGFGEGGEEFSLMKADPKTCYHGDPLACFFHGKPTSASTCACDEGYTGASCNGCAPGYRSYKNTDHLFTDCLRCPDCGQHGKCDVYGGKDNAHACACDAGFTGPACQYSRDATCSRHGTPDAAGACACDTGYAGQNFGGTTVGCWAGRDLTCNSHGDADAANPRRCKCDAGYGGAQCQLSDAVTCSGHGKLMAGRDDGACACSPGYSGSRCETR
jgi:hypothetical protein